jgi:hypothetical protein
MNQRRTFTLAIVFTSLVSVAVADELTDILKDKATLVFEDTFDRVESDDTIEELGPGWETNSRGRANGQKQADLRYGHLVLTRAGNAEHSVTIKHKHSVDDAVLQVRFRMPNAKGFSLLFSDRECKEVVAGHICHVTLKPGSITLYDDKLGIYSKAIKEKKLAGASKQEIARLTKPFIAKFKAPLKVNHWHEATIVIIADRMTVYIDGIKSGELTSQGIDHTPKVRFAIGVPTNLEIDSVRFLQIPSGHPKSPLN